MREKLWDSSSLKQLCTASGLTRDAVAKAIGISLSTLTCYLNEKMAPSLATLIKLSDFFAVPVDVILGRASTEELENILKDYSKYFMQLRRAPYEAYLLSVSQKSPNAVYSMVERKQIDSPWPYNLVDAIFMQPVELAMDGDREKGLEKALSTLTEREQAVLRLRFEEARTLEEVGTIIGVHKERARQIEAKAIRRLRHPARRQFIEYGAEGKQMLDNLKEREAEVTQRENNVAVREQEVATALQAMNKPQAENDIPKDVSIRTLDLSVRSFNCLIRADIVTVAKLAAKAEDGSLIHVRNFGIHCLQECLYKLYDLGLDYFSVYKMAYDDWVAKRYKSA